MPTTTNLLLPYPGLGEAPNGPSQVQALAVAADDLLGAPWVTYVPTISGTGWAFGNAVLDCARRYVGKNVDFRVKITWGTTSTFGSGVLILGLPTLTGTGYARHPGFARRPGGSNYPLSGYVYAAGATTMVMLTDASPMTNVVTAVPLAWAAADVLVASGTYERA